MIHKALLDIELKDDPISLTFDFTVDSELQNELKQVNASISVAPMKLTLSRRAVRQLMYSKLGQLKFDELNHPIKS